MGSLSSVVSADGCLLSKLLGQMVQFIYSLENSELCYRVSF